MTLITVVCYDFVVFNHLKSHTFEKSTLSPCGYFMEIPARKKNVCIFCSALFTYVLKLRDEKTKFIRFLQEQTFFRRQKPDCRVF